MAKRQKFKPSGWTPLAKSMQAAKRDLQGKKGKNNTNIIYVVSDGIETCGGNPTKIAKKLGDSNLKPIVNVIGLDVDSEGQQQLKKVAQAADGHFAYIDNQKKLEQAFNRMQEIADKWISWKFNAESDSAESHFDKGNQIAEADYQWGEEEALEEGLMITAVTKLNQKNRISDDVNEKLMKKINKRKEMVERSGKKINKDLNALNDKSYEKTKKTIEKKYNKNLE